MSRSEKKGGTLVWDAFQENMEDLMLSLNIFDVKPKKYVYAWTNKRVGLGHIVAKIYRFLVPNNLLTFNICLDSSILPWSGSEHRPIALQLSLPQVLGPIPFRFSPLWLESQEFLDLVALSWGSWVEGSLVTIWE